MFPEQSNPDFENDDEPSIDLRRYLALAWHWAWLILLVTTLAAAGSYVYTSQQTPIYQATATLLVDEAPSTRATDYSTVVMNERIAQTYAQMIIRRPALEAVSAQLGLSGDPDGLRGLITVKTVSNTQLMTVSVRHTDPALAAKIANTLGVVFGQQVNTTESARYASSKETLQAQMNDVDGNLQSARNELAALQEQQRQLAEEQTRSNGGTPAAPVTTADMDRLETRIRQYESIYASLLVSFENIRMAEASSLSGISVIEEARVPTAPISPDVPQNTLLGGMVGMLLAAGVIFAIELLDDTLKGPDEITRRFHLPVLGMIAQHGQQEGQLVSLSAPRAPVVEAFRSLRTNIQYASVDHPIRTLLVTSPVPSDGKTTVTSNLAVVLAQSGKRVAMVDADLHRPRVHKVFNMDNDRGLSSLFVEARVHLNGWAQFTPQERLQVVNSGPLPPNPSELLGSNKMREILEALLTEFDMVLLDTPPVLSVTDAAVLAPLVDGVILVSRPGETKLGAVRQAVDALRRVNANLIGVVLNGVGGARGYYAYYYKSYYHYYDRYSSEKGARARLPFGLGGRKHKSAQRAERKEA